MGMYNYFIAEVKCLTCGNISKIEFQSNAGILDLEEFQIGDLLLKKPLSDYRGILSPDKKVFENNLNFWTIGLGVCPICQSDVWAKIYIEDNRFSEAKIVNEPDDIYDWGVVDRKV
jgi:hypothetical protein